MNPTDSEFHLPLTDGEMDEARAMWLDGFDTRDIADELKRRECVIWNAMQSIRETARRAA